MTETESKKFAERLARRASRRLVSIDEKKGFNVARGLSFLGAIGWYMSIPSVAGILLGRWLDRRFPYESISWTINFMLAGMVMGAFSMWFWLKREGIDRAEREQALRDEKIRQAQLESEKVYAENHENDEVREDVV